MDKLDRAVCVRSALYCDHYNCRRLSSSFLIHVSFFLPAFVLSSPSSSLSVYCLSSLFMSFCTVVLYAFPSLCCYSFRYFFLSFVPTMASIHRVVAFSYNMLQVLAFRVWVQC